MFRSKRKKDKWFHFIQCVFIVSASIMACYLNLLDKSILEYIFIGVCVYVIGIKLPPDNYME